MPILLGLGTLAVVVFGIAKLLAKPKMPPSGVKAAMTPPTPGPATNAKAIQDAIVGGQNVAADASGGAAGQGQLP